MYKLSPSDFAYLYEECKLCYCMKIKEGIYQPSMPMPGIFSAINSRLQGTLVGQDLQVLSKDLPSGEVVNQEGWVESVPVPGTNVYIKGKYDLLVDNGDNTFTLVDLKISQADESKIDKYKTQLNAYKFALENPANGEKIIISRLALLIFYPDTVEFVDGVAKFDFPPKWLEIPCDQPGFIEFIRGVDTLLSGPQPEEGEDCKWCKYRHLGETVAHGNNKNSAPF